MLRGTLRTGAAVWYTLVLVHVATERPRDEISILQTEVQKIPAKPEAIVLHRPESITRRTQDPLPEFLDSALQSMPQPSSLEITPSTQKMFSLAADGAQAVARSVLPAWVLGNIPTSAGVTAALTPARKIEEEVDRSLASPGAMKIFKNFKVDQPLAPTKALQLSQNISVAIDTQRTQTGELSNVIHKPMNATPKGLHPTKKHQTRSSPLETFVSSGTEAVNLMLENAFPEEATPSVTTEPPMAIIPEIEASGITFDDQDPSPFGAEGTVRIQKASSEKDFQWYKLYWAADNKRLPGTNLIQVFKKTGDDLEYQLRPTKVPHGATGLMVVTSNEQGEMSTGPVAAQREADAPSWEQMFDGFLKGG